MAEWPYGTAYSSRGEVRKPMTSRSDLAAFIAHELSKWQHDRDPVRLKCLREWCRLQCGSCNAGLDDKLLCRPLRSATAPSRLEPAASFESLFAPRPRLGDSPGSVATGYRRKRRIAGIFHRRRRRIGNRNIGFWRRRRYPVRPSARLGRGRYGKLQRMVGVNVFQVENPSLRTSRAPVRTTHGVVLSRS